MIRNCELVTGRIFEVYKVNKGRAFFTLVIVFYRDSVLEVVHKDHVLLQKRSGFKVLELIDCLRQSIHWQVFVDSLQRGQQDILIKRRVIIALHIWSIDIGISKILIEKLQDGILII